MPDAQMVLGPDGGALLSEKEMGEGFQRVRDLDGSELKRLSDLTDISEDTLLVEFTDHYVGWI